MLCVLISHHLVAFCKPGYTAQVVYENTIKGTNTTQLSILHQTQVQVSFNGLSRSAAGC